jgi:hypothetical protein
MHPATAAGHSKGGGAGTKLAAKCMQEPVNQTVKQVHIAFDAVLDILSLQEERAASLGLPPEHAGSFEAFLGSTAMDLMSLSEHSVPFASSIL